MKASDIFIRALEAEGVKYIFGVPGEENLDMVESLRSSSIKLILTRNEQAAAFMAATHGRLTGRAGVALATLGPGACNLMTGVAYAQLGAMPLVVITGQKQIRKSKQGQFQILDIPAIMRPMTKSAIQIPSGDRIPSIVREAFRLAEEERPGAVHLELPEDIAREESEAKIIPRTHARRAAPDAKSIREAISQIEKAKNPMLMIAAGANRKRISASLAAFITKTGIPFFSTQMGKGVIDERNKLNLGTAALTSKDYIHCAIERADLIIAVGHDVVEKPPVIMCRDCREVIHVNFSSAQVDEVYAPALEVIGDIAESIESMTEQIKISKNWDFAYSKKIIAENTKSIADRSDSDSFPIFPQRFVRDLRVVMPSDGILALDNGIYKIWVARNYAAHARNTVLLDNALATMGAGLPSAIGAKMLNPSKKVVAIVGDGGFGMCNSYELETAIRLKLDLVVVILRDDAYGMIRWKQAGMDFPDFGLEFNNPDLVKYAESFGAHGHRVETADGFADILDKSINSKGVHVIDLQIDYSENIRVLIDELATKVCLI